MSYLLDILVCLIFLKNAFVLLTMLGFACETTLLADERFVLRVPLLIMALNSSPVGNKAAIFTLYEMAF